MKAAKYSYDQRNFLRWAESVLGPPYQETWPSSGTPEYILCRSVQLGVEAEAKEMVDRYRAIKEL